MSHNESGAELTSSRPTRSHEEHWAFNPRYELSKLTQGVRQRLSIATEAERVIELERQDRGAEAATSAVCAQTLALSCIIDVERKVLGVENRLAAANEGLQQLTLGKFVALFVEAEIEVGDELVDLVEVVL